MPDPTPLPTPPRASSEAGPSIRDPALAAGAFEKERAAADRLLILLAECQALLGLDEIGWRDRHAMVFPARHAAIAESFSALGVHGPSYDMPAISERVRMPGDRGAYFERPLPEPAQSQAAEARCRELVRGLAARMDELRPLFRQAPEPARRHRA